MVRQVQITVPNGRADEVVEILRGRDHAHGVVHLPGRQNSVIIFKSVEKHVSDTLAVLEKKGIGVHDSVVDIIELKSTKPLLSTFFDRRVRKKRQYKVTDRMAVEEIYESVDSQCHLTFDYLLFCFAAAMIAGVGLIQDSSVTVVASMLVSPLMGPILGVTFGTVIKTPEMVTRSMRNEMWGILICLAVGVVTGLCVGPFFGPCGIQTSWSATTLRSSQIESRGTVGGIVAGFFAAVPSGIGVALAITGGGINALVGVAISAALLPPVVNAGTCFALAFWYWTCQLSSSKETDTYHNAISEKDHFLYVGAFSFALFLVNFVVIFLMALGVFKLKRVRPWITRSGFWTLQLDDASLPSSGLIANGQGVATWRANPLDGGTGVGAGVGAASVTSADSNYGATASTASFAPSLPKPNQQLSRIGSAPANTQDPRTRNRSNTGGK